MLVKVESQVQKEARRFKRGGGQRVNLCRKNDRMADYYMEVNAENGYQIYEDLDDNGFFYVYVCQYQS